MVSVKTFCYPLNSLKSEQYYLHMYNPCSWRAEKRAVCHSRQQKWESKIFFHVWPICIEIFPRRFMVRVPGEWGVIKHSNIPHYCAYSVFKYWLSNYFEYCPLDSVVISEEYLSKGPQYLSLKRGRYKILLLTLKVLNNEFLLQSIELPYPIRIFK